jgi:riboflavin biosynthesis pyrimidine reductase
MKGTITEEEQIEQILEEANAHNLRQEVITTAETFIKDDPELDKVIAYEMGFMEWVK